MDESQKAETVKSRLTHRELAEQFSRYAQDKNKFDSERSIYATLANAHATMWLAENTDVVQQQVMDSWKGTN